jgi:hypothetical protein
MSIFRVSKVRKVEGFMDVGRKLFSSLRIRIRGDLTMMVWKQKEALCPD